MAKLTKRVVDAAKPPESGDKTIWDSELPGFGLRARPSGQNRSVLEPPLRRSPGTPPGDEGSPASEL